MSTGLVPASNNVRWNAIGGEVQAMTTLTRSIDSLQKAEEVLQEIADEMTVEWFTGSDGVNRSRAGRWMLDTGRLLYDTPRDFLQICLWENLTAEYPDAAHDAAKLESLFRPDAWQVADAVHTRTTWDQFESAVTGEVPLVGVKAKGATVVSIH
jgi:hypothetical protein